MHATTRQFTIIISGSNVEKHDVSLYSKFQGNRINILEITAVFIYDEKKEKPTVFFSILSLNLPPIQISNFWKKSIFQGIGSRQIKSFPIDCTPLLKTIFQKNILWKFLEALSKNTLKFSRIFEKKVFFRVLDLGELGHFPSIAPYFWRPFFKKQFYDFFLKGP